MRLHKPNTTAKSLQTTLLKAIREEYDHNVAEQLFISPEAWGMVKKSKEESIKIINIAVMLLAQENLQLKWPLNFLKLLLNLKHFQPK